MDPATGTFTTMDTYGGSLSDPMSLHKYLFANSNPVMYCDPSGHYTLSEQQTTVAIQSIIGEAEAGIFYIVDTIITDPQMENHSLGGMLFAMLMGFLLGACGGYAKVSASAWAFKMILGAFGISGGILGFFKGIEDYQDGYSIYGILEIILSVILLRSGIKGLSSGWSEKGEYSGLGFDPGSKKGFVLLPGKSSMGTNNSNSSKGAIKDANLPTTGKVRYVPPKKWTPSQPLPKQGNGYVDKFGNIWTKGPSRTMDQPFEWDVQLSNTGKSQFGWATRDNSHLNVSLDGKITHI